MLARNQQTHASCCQTTENLDVLRGGACGSGQRRLMFAVEWLLLWYAVIQAFATTAIETRKPGLETGILAP